jgi:RNA polymerase sigma-70 factor, ECF subfamily
MQPRSKKDVELARAPLLSVRPLPAAGGDISLVSRCVEGDETAWRDLHRTYYPIAAAFLRKLGVTEGELADACQEVFVTLFRHLPTFRGESELKTWLYRLCATEAAKARRRSRLWGTMLRVLYREQEGEPVASLEWSASQARQKVDEALDRMKADERLVFVLFEMEGLKGEQIASIAGCPVATVWRRLHYARRAFSEALGVKERRNEA